MTDAHTQTFGKSLSLLPQLPLASSVSSCLCCHNLGRDFFTPSQFVFAGMGSKWEEGGAPKGGIFLKRLPKYRQNISTSTSCASASASASVSVVCVCV